ncbi:MAG: phospho-N-acetylmuramoyl-pentapeptide-transferase [Planctomycetales bacterium]|nr:phospho-N-acetylmuramoyl-pentapeptide-transferase [Planctomycetales bacterium]
MTSPETRAAAAAGLAFLAVAALGGPFARWLRSRRAGERVEKGDSPRLDALMAGKQDTPTMGGLLVLAAGLGTAALLADLTSRPVLACIAATLLAAGVGLADDLAKLSGRPKGLRIRTRILVEAAIGAGLAVSAFGTGAGAPLVLPGLAVLALPAAALAAFSALTFVATVNAVNVTDGLDGLAPGLVALATAGVAAAAATVAGPAGAGALGIAPVPGAGEVAVFAAAHAGACVGFLWHNCHPARMFLGNVGAVGLGGALAAAATAARVEAALVLAGAMLVAEAGSVALQIASFRLLGRRVFRIAPLHHHFQFGGLPETAVTTRFWIAGAIVAAAGVAAWPR